MTEFEIKPPDRLHFGARELWLYRELFYFFTWRDIKVKYKQTAIGFLWVIIQPLFMMFIFSYFLGQAIAQQAALTMPYDVFALSGLVVWGIFSTGLNNAGNSMVTNANIIKKIYFPRLIIPASAVLVGLFDFVMALVVFIGYCIFRGQPLSMSALYLFPAAAVAAAVATFGTGSLLAALNVKYRDFRYVIPFLIQALLFLTPVIYPAHITANAWANWLLAINPMTAPIELFRAGVTGDGLSSNIVYSGLSALIFMIAGLIYFRKTEAYFADLA